MSETAELQGGAREWIRVSRALETLPYVREELRGGRLSYSQVRAITRVATPRTENALVEAAQSASAAQFWAVATAGQHETSPPLLRT